MHIHPKNYAVQNITDIAIYDSTTLTQLNRISTCWYYQDCSKVKPAILNFNETNLQKQTISDKI
jgi:hypothetical protein